MSTGTNAGFNSWLEISRQGTLSTNSLVSARGWRSYQSRTSLSVSNTFKPPGAKLPDFENHQLYVCHRANGFSCGNYSDMLREKQADFPSRANRRRARHEPTDSSGRTRSRQDG